MKRMHVILVLLAVTFFAGALVSSAQAQRLPKAGFTIKGGFDVMGEIELEALGESETGDMDTGITFAGEYIIGLTDMFGIGPGIAYQFPRGLDEDWPDGKLHFIPFYGALNLCIKTQGSVTPFIAFHLGYNLAIIDSDLEDDLETTIEAEVGEDVSLDVEGGMYWGIGGGLLFSNNIQLELLYNINKGKIKAAGEEVDLEYSKLSISVGYKF